MMDSQKNLPRTKTKEKLLAFLKATEHDKYKRIISTIQGSSRPTPDDKSVRDRAGI